MNATSRSVAVNKATVAVVDPYLLWLLGVAQILELAEVVLQVDLVSPSIGTDPLQQATPAAQQMAKQVDLTKDEVLLSKSLAKTAVDMGIYLGGTELITVTVAYSRQAMLLSESQPSKQLLAAVSPRLQTVGIKQLLRRSIVKGLMSREDSMACYEVMRKHGYLGSAPFN